MLNRYYIIIWFIFLFLCLFLFGVGGGWRELKIYKNFFISVYSSNYYCECEYVYYGICVDVKDNFVELFVFFYFGWGLGR